MNQILLKIATEEEVRQALIMMHPEKALGPGGMTALFFQHYSHVIKKHLVEMVNIFLATGDMDSRLNITDMCMIPKTERPTRMTELRSISLCNVGYKIYLKSFMSKTENMPSTVNIRDTIGFLWREG